MTDLTAVEAYRDLAHRRDCDGCGDAAHRYRDDEATVNGTPYSEWLACEQDGPQPASAVLD